MCVLYLFRLSFCRVLYYIDRRQVTNQQDIGCVMCRVYVLFVSFKYSLDLSSPTISCIYSSILVSGLTTHQPQSYGTESKRHHPTRYVCLDCVRLSLPRPFFIIMMMTPMISSSSSPPSQIMCIASPPASSSQNAWVGLYPFYL